jgi:hypothetical protein
VVRCIMVRSVKINDRIIELVMRCVQNRLAWLTQLVIVVFSISYKIRRFNQPESH